MSVWLKRGNGSVSVFFAATFLSLSSMFLCMAECVRVNALYYSANMEARESEAYLESMYLKKLWTDFGVLGIDASLGAEEVDMAKLQGRASDFLNMYEKQNGIDYLKLPVESLEVKNPHYYTDYGGVWFIKMAARYEKTRFVDKGLDLLVSKLKEESSNAGKKDDFDEKIEKSEKAIIKSQEKVDDKDKDEKEASKYPKEDWSGVSNPIKLAKESRKTKDMSFWTGDKKVSDARIDNSKLFSGREKSLTGHGGVGGIDRALYTEYVFDKFGCFCDEAEDDIKYGAEYLIGGKDSDKENLSAVIKRLMLIREAENILTIESDPAMNSEAGSLATFLAGFTLNPAIIEAVKIGIIASWAYVESVLDIRSLLAGEKVPFYKTGVQFTSKLRELPAYLEKGKRARTFGTGIDYKSCLRALLFVQPSLKLAERSFDLVENHMRKDKYYAKFKVNNMVYKCDVELKTRADSLFLWLVDLKKGKDSYSYKRKVEVDYTK